METKTKIKTKTIRVRLIMTAVEDVKIESENPTMEEIEEAINTACEIVSQGNDYSADDWKLYEWEYVDD